MDLEVHLGRFLGKLSQISIMAGDDHSMIEIRPPGLFTALETSKKTKVEYVLSYSLPSNTCKLTMV